MSKSLKRVEAALRELGLAPDIRRMEDGTRTAADAARALGCAPDQIAKSVMLKGARSGRAHLFITAGGQRVDTDAAAALSGEPLEKADAALIRAQTGFAIGGVAPLGHVHPPESAHIDQRLYNFETVWAAAGTPIHVFPIRPEDLRRIVSIDGRSS